MPSHLPEWELLSEWSGHLYRRMYQAVTVNAANILGKPVNLPQI
jgi:hypothetical protein